MGNFHLLQQGVSYYYCLPLPSAVPAWLRLSLHRYFISQCSQPLVCSQRSESILSILSFQILRWSVSLTLGVRSHELTAFIMGVSIFQPDKYRHHHHSWGFGLSKLQDLRRSNRYFLSSLMLHSLTSSCSFLAT